MKNFLLNSEQTGRQIVTSLKTGRKYYIEVIGSPHHEKFGDINPATKKVEGSYGDKYRGSIDREDSMITEEGGFKNVVELQPGESPYAYIDKIEHNL